MKEWLRLWFLNILGGYPDAQSALEAVESDAERKVFLTRAVSRYFNSISSEDILREQDGEWIFKGKPLPKGVKEELIAEAVALLESRLWDVLLGDAKYQANRKMFLESKTDMDLVAGKLMVFLTDVLRTRLKSMAEGTGMYNRKS